jgi:oligopeptide/dipeptide ABC transporter ATP-binding protein
VVRYLCDRVAVMYLGQIVEIAPREELFTNPRHPYTRVLLAASLAEEHGSETIITQLKGEPPSPIDPPSGCRFHPRCPMAQDICRTTEPPTAHPGVDHLTNCHFWDQLPTIPGTGAATPSSTR